MSRTTLVTACLALWPLVVAQPRLLARPPVAQPLDLVNPITSFDGAVTAIDSGTISIVGFGVTVRGVTSGGGSVTGAESYAGGPDMVVGFPDRDIPCVSAWFSRETITLVLRDGTSKTLRRANQPVRRFPADAVLAGGGFHKEATPGFSYRLSDVRVGDEVDIRLCRTEMDGLCYAISIRRRPGGRVPPAPAERADARIRFHEVMNAYQDYEENGTAIPAKFLPPEPVPPSRLRPPAAPR